MAHRNRWFTVLKNGGSFHGELVNNQMVTGGYAATDESADIDPSQQGQ
jgi:hypothetical protein